MFSQLLTIILILLWSGSKFLVGLGLIFYHQYSFLESILLSVSGGMLGIAVFSYLGNGLQNVWRKLFSPQHAPKKIFTSRNRLIVKIRRRYGLAGIAFLTPLVLTVPVGAILANSMYKNKLQIYVYMLASFFFWAMLLCGLYYGLGIDLNTAIHSLLPF